MTAFAIQTRSLVKTYTVGGGEFFGGKTIHAVDGLSLNVPEGSIYGLLGRNAAGKTTTIRMAMGLARPTSGTIEVFGLNPAQDPERVRVLEQVGYVPEDKILVGGTPRGLLTLNRAFYPDTWSDESPVRWSIISNSLWTRRTYRWATRPRWHSPQPSPNARGCSSSTSPPPGSTLSPWTRCFVCSLKTAR